MLLYLRRPRASQEFTWYCDCLCVGDLRFCRGWGWTLIRWMSCEAGTSGWGTRTQPRCRINYLRVAWRRSFQPCWFWAACFRVIFREHLPCGNARVSLLPPSRRAFKPATNPSPLSFLSRQNQGGKTAAGRPITHAQRLLLLIAEVFLIELTSREALAARDRIGVSDNHRH